MLEFSCPNCGKAFRVEEELSGRMAKCRSCGNRLTIPSVNQFPPREPCDAIVASLDRTTGQGNIERPLRGVTEASTASLAVANFFRENSRITLFLLGIAVSGTLFFAFLLWNPPKGFHAGVTGDKQNANAKETSLESVNLPSPQGGGVMPAATAAKKTASEPANSPSPRLGGEMPVKTVDNAGKSLSQSPTEDWSDSELAALRTQVDLSMRECKRKIEQQILVLMDREDLPGVPMREIPAKLEEFRQDQYMPRDALRKLEDGCRQALKVTKSEFRKWAQTQYSEALRVGFRDAEGKVGRKTPQEIEVYAETKLSEVISEACQVFDELDRAMSGDSLSDSSRRKNKDEGKNKGIRSQTTSSSAVDVTANELARQYRENHLAADKRYKGRILRIKGSVESVNRDVLPDSISVTLVSDSEIEFVSILCYFKEEWEDELSKLRPAQNCTIQGKCEGRSGYVILKDCELK